MKNTNITNTYLFAIGIALISAVFALPVMASAQDVVVAPDYSYGTAPDYSYPTSPDYSYGTAPDYSYASSPIITSSPAYTVVGGGFYGGGSYAYPSYSYGYPGSTVSSGSFGGGTTYNVNPTYTYLPNQTVSSGGFNGGTTYVGTVYQGAYGPLNGSCSSSFNTGVNGGPQVTWTGIASGGNGIYSYYWTGDEGLVAQGQYVSKTYLTNGVKNVYLTINSGDGQTITRTCSATVGNQVLAFTATNPNLQSVYLSNVPYTGAGDVAKVVGFLSVLMLWSAGLAYVFLKRKEKMESIAVASVTAGNASENANYLQDFKMETGSDIQAMESIETYARMNQVLLSSDAVKELVKLARLKKADPKEIIRKASGAEWMTLGENDIAKYF